MFWRKISMRIVRSSATFFKTVFLVMIIGVVHAIVFLPVLLSLLIRPTMCCKFVEEIRDRDDAQLAMSFCKAYSEKRPTQLRQNMAVSTVDEAAAAVAGRNRSFDNAQHQYSSIFPVADRR